MIRICKLGCSLKGLIALGPYDGVDNYITIGRSDSGTDFDVPLGSLARFLRAVVVGLITVCNI